MNTQIQEKQSVNRKNYKEGTCDECDRHYKDLKGHIKSKHSGDLHKIKCEVCEKKYVKCYLTSHKCIAPKQIIIQELEEKEKEWAFCQECETFHLNNHISTTLLQAEEV